MMNLTRIISLKAYSIFVSVCQEAFSLFNKQFFLVVLFHLPNFNLKKNSLIKKYF